MTKNNIDRFTNQTNRIDKIFCRPVGPTITGFITQLSAGISNIRKNRGDSPEFEELNSAVEEARLVCSEFHRLAFSTNLV